MQHIPGLDLLRFIGAISVIALHLQALKDAPPWLARALSGENGVTLFYVISGFLITSLICREVQATGSLDVQRFMLKRALRIFPLYYFALLCYGLTALAGIQKPFDGSLWFAAAYSYNFIPRAMYDGWLGSFHTLATEEHFYLLYPLLWLALLRLRIPPWPVLLVLVAFAPVFLSWSRPLAGAFFIERWTFNAWAPILIGCLAGYYFAQEERTHEGRRYFLPLAALLICAAAVQKLAVPLACGFALLILHLAYNQTRSWVAALNAMPIRFLGQISYGLYVWQSFILSTAPGRRLVHDPWVAALLVFILAVASWFLLEKPLLKLRSAISRLEWQKRSPATATGTPVAAKAAT